MFKLFIIFTVLYIIGRLNEWHIRKIRFDGIYFYYTVRIWNPAYNEWQGEIRRICLWRYNNNDLPY